MSRFSSHPTITSVRLYDSDPFRSEQNTDAPKLPRIGLIYNILSLELNPTNSFGIIPIRSNSLTAESKARSHTQIGNAAWEIAYDCDCQKSNPDFLVKDEDYCFAKIGDFYPHFRAE